MLGSISCLFEDTEGDASEPILAQITICSQAHKSSAPVTFSTISIEFDGVIDSIEIQHEQSDAESADIQRKAQTIQEVPLTDASQDRQMSRGSVLIGSANLQLAPEQMRVIDLEITPRESGDISFKSATMVLEESALEVRCTSKKNVAKSPPVWWAENAEKTGLVSFVSCTVKLSYAVKPSS